MKFFLFLSVVLIFTACGNNTIEIETPSNSDTVLEVKENKTPSNISNITELTGLLKSQNISLTSKATHLLLDEFGEIITQLKSSTVNLSAYENKKVNVMGKMDNTQDIKILTVEQITEYQDLASLPEISEDIPSITWQKFQDAESRFSFSYPNLWQIKPMGRVTYLNQAEANLIKISRLENGNNLSLTTFITTPYQEITVNKNPALRTNTADGFAIYLASVDEILKISFYKNNNETDLEDYFTEFLNSFTVYTEINEIHRCGVGNKLCPEGFRCELEKNDIGVCVPVDTVSLNKDNKTVEITEIANNLDLNNKEDLTNDTEKIVTTLDQFTTIPSDSYQNNVMQYQVYYPKAWWYKSFGSTDKALWLAEFSKTEIENPGEGSIVLSIKHGARGLVVQEDLLNFTVLLPRDSSSHFEITANIEYKNEVASMAKTLQNSL